MTRFRVLRLALVGLGCALLVGCAQSQTGSPLSGLWPSWLGGPRQPEAKSELLASGASQSQSRPGPVPSTVTTAGGALGSELALARLLERRGETGQAGRIYAACLGKEPRNPTAHHRLGVIAAKEGRFPDAEDHLQQARRLGPPNAELLSDLGYVYYLQHRLPEAEQTLNEALALEPKHQAACNNLGLVLGAQGRFAESLAVFKQVNSEGEAYANLAYVLAQRGEFQRSEDAYLHALTLDNRLQTAAAAMLQVAQRRRAHSAEKVADQVPPPARRERSGPTDADALVQITEGREVPGPRNLSGPMATGAPGQEVPAYRTAAAPVARGDAPPLHEQGMPGAEYDHRMSPGDNIPQPERIVRLPPTEGPYSAPNFRAPGTTSPVAPASFEVLVSDGHVGPASASPWPPEQRPRNTGMDRLGDGPAETTASRPVFDRR